jgi:antitoxin HicB
VKKGEEEVKRKGRFKQQVRVAEVDEATIRLHIEPLAEGGYLATSRDVPGLVAEGRSIIEAVEIAQGLTRKIVESCLEHGDPLPPALVKMRKPPLDLLIPVGVR